MPAIDPRTTLVLGLIAAAPLASCSRSGGGSEPVPETATRVDAGDPVLAPRSGYVGSQVCGSCHRELFDDWSETLHARSLRNTNRPGATGRAVVADSDGDGTDDFREALDLSNYASNDQWTRFGPDAPKLAFRAGDPMPYKVRIGSLTYDILRTYGGNGLWQQRFITRIGESHYVLPIEFDETSRAWVTFRPEDWYGPDDRPRFDDPSLLVAEVSKESAFEFRCAGCHNLGLDLQVSTSTQEILSGYAELSNGCESCHGPGADHVARGGGLGSILNPRHLLDGSTSGAARASETCGRCHSRGTGGTIPGTSGPVEFAWSPSLGPFEPGDVLADFLAFTQDPNDYWGRDDTGRFIASRSSYQQLIDKENGPHASSRPGTPACFDCHDAHSRAQLHQIRRRITNLGVTYRTRADDDTLCLACHHGATARRDFRAISDADVQAIADGEFRDVVRSEIVVHLANAGMLVTEEQVDPAGPTKVGHCVTCHMPFTATSAESTPDQFGFAKGNLHGHTFDPIYPSVSHELGVTSSCTATGCHPLAGDPNEPGWLTIEEWARDGPDEDGRFHADSPSPSQTGRTLTGFYCAQCHTTEGFVAIQVEGRSMEPAEAAALVEKSIARHEGITCQACHGVDPTGTLQPGNVRYPQKRLCRLCHNAMGLTFEILAENGGVERHPQFEMLRGRGGGEVPGETYTFSQHTVFLLADGCAVCHVVDETGASEKGERGRPGHTFEPTIRTCQISECHANDVTEMTQFDRPARGDYDGSGNLDGIQTEILGLLDILTLEIQSRDSRLSLDKERQFVFDGSPENVRRSNGFSDPVLRAIFNVYFVRNDASNGVHNAAYAVELLQKSYRELTGQDVPNADIRND